MKTILNIFVLLAVAVSVVSCAGKGEPNYQYMPNMYVPVGYEAYGEYDVFENGQEAMLPAPGSIPRGWEPYDYENTTEGKALAAANLQNPLEVNEANLAAGGQLYTIYCAVCHGDQGNGKGILVQREKFLGIPSYDDPGRNITPGDIYHVQMYGLNSMGSYASQTNQKERWQIAMHVMELKAALTGTPGLLGAPADSTATPVSDSIVNSESTNMAKSTEMDNAATNKKTN